MTSMFAVDGLISGLRTSDIIQQMMALERRPLDALTQKRALEQQRADALRDITTRLGNLQAKAAGLALRSTINAKSASVGTATAVSATAGADAVNGAFQVTVSQLATATRVSSTTAAGQAIVRTNSLTTAGFGTTPTSGTFTINGIAITVADASATLLDDGNPGSLVDLINSAGAGVTASIVADADGRLNRFQLVSSAGDSIQLGAGADTSNLLSVLKLAGALVEGNTAATVDGTPVSAGAIVADFTVNGEQVVINTDAGNTGAQNAEAIRLAINAAGANVTATVNPDDSLSLTYDTTGSAGAITIAGTITGTGLSAGTTQNGTDKAISSGNLGTVSSGAALNSAEARLTTALAGLDGDGNGSFKVNGVTITFNGTETLNAVLSRINSSSAGVTAAYDSVQDKVSLTSSRTGTALISLEAVTSNFLTAVGLAGATQTVGSNALYTVSTVNGGGQLSSASNTVTGVVPGVTLSLKEVAASPVTVTVSQNVSSTVAAVRGFVDQFNSTMELIGKHTDYDAVLKKAGLLMADGGVRGIETQLRRLVSAPAVGATGTYTNLASLGVTTGNVGSAVGSTTTLQLDDAKLTTALNDNPAAVEAVLSSFSSTAVLSGAGPISAISGVPTGHHEPGAYAITSTDGTSVTSTFTPDSGGSWTAQTATIAPAATNTTLIPGMTLTGSGVVGTSTITVAVQSRGIGHTLNDYLTNLTSSTGLLDSRADQNKDTIAALDKQATRLEERLADKEERLRRRFNALEAALAKLQNQSSQLSAQLAQFSNQSA